MLMTHANAKLHKRYRWVKAPFRILYYLTFDITSQHHLLVTEIIFLKQHSGF